MDKITRLHYECGALPATGGRGHHQVKSIVPLGCRVRRDQQRCGTGFDGYEALTAADGIGYLSIESTTLQVRGAHRCWMRVAPWNRIDGCEALTAADGIGHPLPTVGDAAGKSLWRSSLQTKTSQTPLQNAVRIWGRIASVWR